MVAMDKQQEKVFKEKARKLADLALQKQEEESLSMDERVLINVARQKGVSVEKAREELAKEGISL